MNKKAVKRISFMLIFTLAVLIGAPAASAAMPTLTYSGEPFTEREQNDGGIGNSIIVDSTINFRSNAVNRITAAGVPEGLQFSVVRVNNRRVTLSLTGRAVNHQSADNATVTVTFAHNAFNPNADGSIVKVIQVNFNDNTPTLTYSTDTFNESGANNGYIDTTCDITLSGDTFTGINGNDFVSAGKVSVSNVPEGLTPVITRTGGTTLRMSLIGMAESHQQPDSVNNMTVVFSNSAFTGGNASNVENHDKNDLKIIFSNNPYLTYEGDEFFESDINNGTITNTIGINLTGAEFRSDYFSSADYTATNVPSGLNLYLVRINSTAAELRLTGTAYYHAASGSIANMGISLMDSAFSGTAASQVADSAKTDLKVTFTDGIYLTYEGGPFVESFNNDGSIANSKEVILKNGEFVNEAFVEGVHFTTQNVPAGLAMAIERTGNRQLYISFNGKASAHETENSVNNAGVTFTDNAFAGGNAAMVNNSSKNDVEIRFTTFVPIRVLEVYPSMIQNSGDGDFMELSSLYSDPRYEVTSMSLNRFISLTETVNGNYDVVYFAGGRYFRNGVEENRYGNDITNKKANQVINFINSGQLCIFHSSAFLRDSIDSANPIGQRDTIMISALSSYISRSNVYQAENPAEAENLIEAVASHNLRPLIEMFRQPASYKTNSQPLENNILSFIFKVDDESDSALTVKLYIDRNNDSLFDANELVETRTVNSGKYGSITYLMPNNLTGVFFWKLEATDSQGASSQIVDVFRLLGEEIVVRVLQVEPPGNTGDLSELFGRAIPGEPGSTLGQRPGEYRIDLTQVSINSFNNPPVNDTNNLRNLNGNYDMIVLGFADSYGNENMTQEACDRLQSFIDTKQGVMFTHDTVIYDRYQPTWNLRTNFLNTVGQTSAIAAGQVRRNVYDNWNYSIFNPLVTNYGLNRTAINAEYSQISVNASYLTNMIKKVNTTAITLYPFNIESKPQNEMVVAGTHKQYYKLNLEQDDVIPLFNLYRNDINGRLADDAMNNYYTYSKGNITYSGTGHQGGYPDYEVMLYANTMLKAYSGANHAPVIYLYEPIDGSRTDASINTINLKFKLQDYDYNDTHLSYRIYIDRENNGNYESAADERTVSNGQMVETVIDKGFSDARRYRVKIEAWDSSNAVTFKEITLDNTELPMLIFNKSTDKNGYLAGETVTVNVNVLASGKVISAVTVEPELTETIPSGVEYNGISTGTTATPALSSVTFTGSNPSPISQNASYTVVPVTGGNAYTIAGQLSYELYGNTYTSSGNVGFDVRSARINVYAKDDQNNPVKETRVYLNEEDMGITNIGGQRLLTDIPAGSGTIKVEAPAGYTVESLLLKNIITGVEQEVSGNEVTLDASYDDYSWEITCSLSLSMQINVAYYAVYIDGTVEELTEVNNTIRAPKDSEVFIAARFSVPSIPGFKELSINTVTTDEGVVIPVGSSSDYLGRILSSSMTLDWSGEAQPPVQMYEHNDAGAGYIAEGDYYTVIKVNKAKSNINVKVDSFYLVFENTSEYTVQSNGVNIDAIIIMELEVPNLR